MTREKLSRPGYQFGEDAQPRTQPRPISPGKVTLTSKIPRGGRDPVQRKAAGQPAPAPAAPPAGARAARDWTRDVWMDMAHRGCTALVQARLDPQAPAHDHEDAGGAPAPDRGTGMPAAVQAKMERAFGADFSAVRIHDGTDAQAAGALAYAQGTDIHFAPGQYDPHSPRGQELLGHELAHVVQQAQGRVRAPAQGKGLAVNSDPALEREADRMGERAARGEVMDGAPAVRPASSRGVPLQRKTAVGLMTDVATSDISRDLLRRLVVEHGLAKYAEVLEKGALGLVDYFIGADLAASFVPSLKDLLTYLNPYLGAVQTLRSVFRVLPEPVQKVAVYLMGRGLTYASNGYLRGIVTEAWVNKLLVGPDWGASIDQMVSWITWLHGQLDSIARWPVTRLYEMSWALVSQMIGSQAASPATFALEKARGVEDQPEDEQASEGRDRTEERAEDQDQRGSGERTATANALARADLKYIWLEIDQPRLDRWQEMEKDKPVERGGLVLPFQFGLNLFGTRLETLQEQTLQLPWSGGFAMHLQQMAITPPRSLAPVFTVGTLMLDEVLVTEKGLQAFAVSIHDMSFADGAVQVPLVQAQWQQGKGLVFRGAMDARVLDKTVHGEAELGLDAGGGFDHGTLMAQVVDDVPVIPGALVLGRPGFRGGVDRDGTVDISVFSDVRSAFAIFALDVRNAHIDYHKGQGHELKGGVDELSLRIGEHVLLTVKNAALERGWLHIDEASLVYEHDPRAPARDSEALQAIAFPTQFLQFVGLESLRIGGKVKGIDIRASKVQAAQTTLDPIQPSESRDAPPEHGGEAEREQHERPGVSVDSVAPVLSKLGVRALGVAAEVDLENGRGKVAGDIEVAPEIPSLDFEFPIIPQILLMGHLSLEARATLGATLAGTLEKHSGSPEIPFHLGSEATLTASLGVLAKAGVHVGTHFLASLGASLFAEARAEVTAGAGLSGVLYIDPGARTVRIGTEPEDAVKAHYALSAALQASLGVVVEARAFYVFKGTLFKYTFKTWDLGNYLLEGDIDANAAGGYEVDHQKGAFEGADGKPRPPIPEVEEIADARQLMLKNGLAIPGSGEERQRIIQELVEGYRKADEPVARAVAEAAVQAAELRRSFVERNREMAQKGVLDTKDMQEHEERQRKIESANEVLERLRQDYREVQLVLVDWESALEQVKELERGAFDIASLEARIRETAEARGTRKEQLEEARLDINGARQALDLGSHDK
jgi:Domain of unknown function (DUF4157)